MKRYEKAIELSKSVPYSKEELKILHGLLNYKLIHLNQFYDDDLSEIISCIDGTLSGKGYSIDREQDSEELAHFKELNFLQFLLVYFKRIFFFLMYVSSEKVPLYINDHQLGVFAEWRLCINK